MASANPTNKVPLLKRIWGSKIAEPFYEQSPFHNTVQKDTKFGGEGRYVVITISPTAGGSSNFTEALANQDASTDIRFFVPHRKEYQLFSIQNDLIARSQGDKNAIVDAVKHELGKARYAFFRALAARAWGHAGGAKGVISAGSNVATTTITLATRSNVVGFERGMWVQTASTDGLTGALNDAGRKIQITNVNRRTGDLTANAAWNTIAGTATGHRIFRAGDFGNAMTGAQGWAPTADPSGGESFHGQDRTTLGDLQRVSGIRVNGAGATKQSTLNKACAEAQLQGSTGPDRKAFLNPIEMGQLIDELGSKVRYMDRKGRGEGTIGFSALVVDAPGGQIDVLSEPDVPEGFAWIVNTSEVFFRTAGDAPMLLGDGDGPGKLMVHPTDDAKQGRLGCYGNYTWENPGAVVIVQW